MTIDKNFEAFLNIVHVSDIHCKDGGSPTDLRSELILQELVAMLRLVSEQRADFVEKLWEQGLAGHDPDAFDEMCYFLKRFSSDSEFGGIETWLLDTGDLSSMGDESSLNTAYQWLFEFQNILNAKNLFYLYGNHDAWPEKFPCGSPKADLVEHRNVMRSNYFPNQWPQGPLSIVIPHTSSRLLLYGVNSAIDDRWFNSFALGAVGSDPNWARAGEGTDQLEQLARNVELDFNPDEKTRDFRILAVHHPVHYPPPRPKYNMSLMNDKAVANALVSFDQKKCGKLAHIVLSGHTHETYPQLGKLPPNSNAKRWLPLTDGQLQLVAGSLAQMPRHSVRATAFAHAYVPHQFQILTFFASPRDGHRLLLVERRVVGRPGGRGPFTILPLPDPSQLVESIKIEY